MRTIALRLAVLAATLVMFASTGSAYYFFVHYTSKTAPFIPIYEKFDLTSLPNNTVNFYISDTGPSALAPGDTFAAIVSEIRSAAQVWNNVSTSALKLNYAGLYPAADGQVTAGITVDFSDELPPGVIALGGPLTYAGNGNGQFVPILHSTLRIQRDLSQPQTACGNNACPSFSEYFFTTVVHEFGHTMGLQHTFTSAVMSTAVTSASTKASPLSIDDIAGISFLYPVPPAKDAKDLPGSISGTVKSGNSGVPMASVVALSPNGQAISAITNPDGTYRIDNVPDGVYEVYVHPLPPPLQTEVTPGNIVAPKDPDGKPLPFPATAFTTQFYNNGNGTQNFFQASNVYVNPGAVTSDVNFSVRSRAYPAISSVRVYGYSQTSVAVPSAPVPVSSAVPLVAFGVGLLQNSKTLTSGLTLSVLGSGSSQSEQITNLAPYVSGYVSLDVTVGVFAGTGPKHLLFNTKDDLYVLPSGFSVVSAQPPAVTSVTPTTDADGNHVLDVSGTNLDAKTTRIMFDGLPGTITGGADDGGLLVVPPPAPGSWVAVVSALNADGQSSNFLSGSTPVTYTYDPADPPSLAVAPDYLSPNDSTVIDVIGDGTNFIDGQVAAGFGTPDVVVNSVTVLSPTHMQVIVTLNSSAVIPSTQINVVDGLALIAQSQGSTVQTQEQLAAEQQAKGGKTH